MIISSNPITIKQDLDFEKFNTQKQIKQTKILDLFSLTNAVLSTKCI